METRYLFIQHKTENVCRFSIFCKVLHEVATKDHKYLIRPRNSVSRVLALESSSPTFALPRKKTRSKLRGKYVSKNASKVTMFKRSNRKCLSLLIVAGK